MFDIHSHLLPFVDDGCNRLEDSVSLIKIAREQGVTDMMLTPHYRDKYVPTKQELDQTFAQLTKAVSDAQIDINLYLGQEVYVGRNFKNLILEQKVIPLNGTKYILIEFDFTKKRDIIEYVYETRRLGYTPIVAHLERYSYSNLALAFDIKNLGGLVQVNAESLVGLFNITKKNFVTKMIKNNLVDFVSSDMHKGREYHMAKAYAYVERKFGEPKAEKLFKENAEKFLKG